MEILLAACLLAWAAGAQSERAALGVSPAQRALIKEQVRHEKTVQKIAEKHGTAVPPPSTGGGVPLSKTSEPAAPGTVPAAPEPLTVPAAFLAGYRGHTPVARVATPVGQHVGGWAARGVAWTKDSGRSAVKEFRKRRAAEGKPDPAPVLAPIPPMPTEPPTVGTTPAAPEATAPPAATVPPKPTEPPTAGTATVPPMPAEPPTAGSATPPTAPGTDGEDPWSDTDDNSGSAPKAPEKAPEAASEPPAAAPGGTEPPEPPTGPQGAAEAPTVVIPAPRPAEPAEPGTPEAVEPPESGPEPAPHPVPETTGDGGSKTTPTTQGGIGRMASEVSYGSVMEESDELALMCDDDLLVYQRIKDRCTREIGRADELKAQLKSGPVQDWITRCQEQYRQLLTQLEDLEKNTVSQAEAVVKAKALLEQGQGLYADIALDMESVEERQFYISDQTDAEDTSAASETYETKGASA